MISKHSTRDKGRGETYDFGTAKIDLKEALISLIKFELAYGGQITDCTETRVAVRTRVLNCIDDTVFTGTAKEMEPLVRAAAYWLFVVDGIKKEHESGIMPNELDHLMEITKGIPLLIHMSHGIILGHPRAKATAAMLFNPTTEEQVKKLMEMSLEDMLDMAAMKETGEATEEELAIFLG